MPTPLSLEAAQAIAAMITERLPEGIRNLSTTVVTVGLNPATIDVYELRITWLLPGGQRYTAAETLSAREVEREPDSTRHNLIEQAASRLVRMVEGENRSAIRRLTTQFGVSEPQGAYAWLPDYNTYANQGLSQSTLQSARTGMSMQTAARAFRDVWSQGNVEATLQRQGALQVSPLITSPQIAQQAQQQLSQAAQSYENRMAAYSYIYRQGDHGNGTVSLEAGPMAQDLARMTPPVDDDDDRYDDDWREGDPEPTTVQEQEPERETVWQRLGALEI